MTELEQVVRFEEALSRLAEAAAGALFIIRAAHVYPAPSRAALLETLADELALMEAVDGDQDE